MNVGSTSVDRAPALQAGLLSWMLPLRRYLCKLTRRRRIYGFFCSQRRLPSTRSRMARLASAPSSSSPCSTEARVCSFWFWLTFHFPSSRSIFSSRPTMPRAMAAMKSSGSVGYAPRSGPRGLVGVREGVEVSEEPFRIFDYAKRTVSVDDGVVPGWGRPCRSRPSPDTSSA